MSITSVLGYDLDEEIEITMDFMKLESLLERLILGDGDIEDLGERYRL